jgi:hypothetical protein
MRAITVRRSSRDGVDSYHVGEADPEGPVDMVVLWRTVDGYFGEITFRDRRPSVSLDQYNHWSLLKNDLTIWLHDRLRCPEFNDESRLRPPLFCRDFR